MAREGEYSSTNPYALLRIYAPKSIEAKLKEISKRTGMPVSHLVLIALDNELDAPAPFAYPCEMPSSVFVENAYMDEAQKIAVFMNKFKDGMDRRKLNLFRRDIGIPNRADLMLGLRELMEVGVVIEVDPPLRSRFKFPEGHKFLRLKHVDRSTELTRKKRLAKQLQEEIEREEARIKEKEASYRGDESK